MFIQFIQNSATNVILYKSCIHQTNQVKELFGLSILIERIGRIAVIVTETECQLGGRRRLLVAGHRQMRADIIHAQLAQRVDIALEVVLAEVLHQLLYCISQAKNIYFSCQPT